MGRLWIAGVVLVALVGRVGMAADRGGGFPIAEAPRVVWESEDPSRVYPRSPGLLRLDDGRLVLTFEYNLGAKQHLSDAHIDAAGRWHRALVHLSDDGGASWRASHRHPVFQGRAFTAGERLYILGHAGDLGIIASDDRGETWTEPTWLTQDQRWHAAPCNVRYAHGRVYLVMERQVPPYLPFWPVESHAPVVLSARVDADLTQRASWTFSNELTFRELVRDIGGVHGIGVPFYMPGPTVPAASLRASRPMGLPGWLETHLVTFPDPDHLWHDPEDRTMYLYARSYTGMTNRIAIAKATESEDGSITVEPVRAPSGAPVVYVGMPGGHLKFYLLYDAQSKLYWLASNQSTDSMTRPDRLPKSRYMLADNERDRLVLHFSKNAVDWVYAGLVDKTGRNRQPRSYPSMVVDGDDLLIVARSGNARSKNAHDGNIITLHRVKDFRALAY